jgi:hypothetical protein
VRRYYRKIDACHQGLWPAPPSDLLDFVEAFPRVFLASSRTRSSRIGTRCTLRTWPDFRSTSATPPCGETWDRNMRCTTSTPLTFAENSHDRRMRYYPRDPSPFWVEVVIRKADRHIETRKYRGEELVCHAAGPDFQKAMIPQRSSLSRRTSRMTSATEGVEHHLVEQGRLPVNPIVPVPVVVDEGLH